VKNYISSIWEDSKIISKDRKIKTLNSFQVKDKHGIDHKVFNICYEKDGFEYGLNINKQDSIYHFSPDKIDSNYYEELLSSCFPRKRITHIKSNHTPKSNIYYDLFKVEYSIFSFEYFLFLGKYINKSTTIKIFFEENTIDKPLIVSANKRYLDDERNIFWKKDFINKFNVYSAQYQLNNWQFFFLNEFIWKSYLVTDTGFDEKYFEDEAYYINPMIDVDEITLSRSGYKKENIYVIKHFEEWLSKFEKPFYFVLGEAGIGKSTVLKRLYNHINRNEPEKIALFIDASLVSNRANYDEHFLIPKIETLFDLIELYYSNFNLDFHFPTIQNRNVLDLAISSGNIIIIIDGLDELSASLKENFSFNVFLKNILNVNSLLNQTKIIISSRNYFWDVELIKDLEKEFLNVYSKMILKGFNIDLAIEYFKIKLDQDNDLVEEAIALLKALSKDKEDFSPFIVYLVSDMITKRADAIVDEIEYDSIYLDPSNYFDYILLQIFKREQFRQFLNIDIDDFMNFMFEIVLVRSNYMKIEQFNEYMNVMLAKAKNRKHMLTNSLVNVENDIISISHDSLYDHFLVIFMSYYILQCKHDMHIYHSLSRYCDGKSNLLLDLRIRMEKDSQFTIKLPKFISQTLNFIQGKKSSKEKVYYEKTISTLLYLVMFSSNFGDKNLPEDRSRILLELLGGNLNHLHIYGDFYSLDFRSLKVTNSSLNNYRGLFESLFNKDTLFIDTKFNFKQDEFLDFIKNKSNLTLVNFDSSCSLFEDFGTLIERPIDCKSTIIKLIRSDLIKLFKKFFVGNKKFVTVNSFNLKIPLSSSIDKRKFFRILWKKEVLVNLDERKVRVGSKYKNSIKSLLVNNYTDMSIQNLISEIYSLSIKDKLLS
jgi:hypothetical protein